MSGLPATIDAGVLPLLDAASLRAAGREPAAPFRVALAAGGEIVVHELLRVLPGKRIVGAATMGGRRVLAKLFIAPASARHCAREREGLQALAAGGIPTPALIQASALAGGGHLLATEFIDAARSLAEAWQVLAARPAGDPEALALLRPALRMLARMHAAGLCQDDLHLGNFLLAGGELLVIDGDDVRAAPDGQALAPVRALDNLALFVAQLPVVWDGALDVLLDCYDGSASFAVDELAAAVGRIRRQRVRDFLGKTIRDCTQFAVEHSALRFTSVLREAQPVLRPLLAALDQSVDSGQILKAGRTCTVAAVTAGPARWVVKRYNLKHVGHALMRAWRPSRAWHSWREAHRLRCLGIATPQPLALVEERLGPLRRRAWLVMEFCAGVDLLEHLSPDVEPPPAEASAIRSLFGALCRLQITHGDLKATNLIWSDERIVLIDLDATVQHKSPSAFAAAWRRDRSRLLRNWPENAPLHRWLERNLPPA